MSTLRVEALEQPDGTAFVFNNKNLLINGGQNIWQRSISASVSSDTLATVDRWRNGINGMGVFTVSRSTDVPAAQGFGYSCKYDCTTADTSPAAGDYIAHYQMIEGQNLQHLLKGTSSAKAVTVSFWVKSNKTGTYILDLFDNDNTRQISKAYTIDSASTWEKKTITFPGDTVGTLDNDNAQSMRLLWWMGAGSNFSSGTLNTSWASTVEANRAVGQVNLADSTSNEFYITGCQLEVGSTASGFEFENVNTLLHKCYRYFYQVNNRTLGVARNSADLYNSRIDHPVPMRASPSLFSGSFTAHTGNNGTASISASRFVGSDGTQSMNILNGANNWTSGAWIAFTGGLGAEL